MDTEIQVGHVWQDQRSRDRQVKVEGLAGTGVWTRRINRAPGLCRYPLTYVDARMFLRRFRRVEKKGEGG